MEFNDYKLAYAYKKTKLWQKLGDDELFAVKRENDQIIFLCIRGKEQGCALCIYPDEESFQSYYRFSTGLDSYDLITGNEILLSQDYLQCAFDSKKDLTDAEQKELREAVKQLGIHLSGKNACAHFIKFEPYRLPRMVMDAQDKAVIADALEAAVDISGLLKDCKPEDLGIHHTSLYEDKLPLFTKKDGHYVPDGVISVPKRIHFTFPTGRIRDQEKINALKKMHRLAGIECRLIHLMTPVEDDGQALFPVVLLTTDKTTGNVLGVSPNERDDPDEVVEHLLDALLEAEKYPQEIDVEEERTAQLLEGFSRQTGIRLKRVIAIENIQHAYTSMLQFMNDEEESGEDELRMLIDELLLFDAKELRQLPKDALDVFELMLASGILNDEEEEKMQKILHKAGRI